MNETINAKQMQNQILFDPSGFTSDDKNLKDAWVLFYSENYATKIILKVMKYRQI